MTCSRSEQGCIQTPGNMVEKSPFPLKVFLWKNYVIKSTERVMIIAAFSTGFEHLCNTD